MNKFKKLKEKYSLGVETADYICKNKVIEINDFFIYDIIFLNKTLEKHQAYREKVFVITQKNTEITVGYLVLTRLIGNIIIDISLYTESKKEIDFEKELKIAINLFIAGFIDNHYLIVGGFLKFLNI